MEYNVREGFKGRGGGRGSNGAGAALGVAGLGMMSQSGKNQMCPLDNDSFFCQLSRFTSVVGMVVYLLVIFTIFAYLIYLAYSYFNSKR